MESSVIMGSRFSGKESVCSAGDPGLIAGSGRFSREGNGYPLQLFLPGESHGQRSLTGYSPWGRKELDTTEQLTFSAIYFESGPVVGLKTCN